MEIASVVIGIILFVAPIFLVFYAVKARKKIKAAEKNVGTLNATVSRLTNDLNKAKKSGGDIKQLSSESSKMVAALGGRVISDNLKFVAQKLTPNNYATSHSKLEKVVTFCDNNGHSVPKIDQNKIYADLKDQYQVAVRKDFQKKEQQRIKEQIRKEQRYEKDMERELRKIASEQDAIEKALALAIAKATDEHDSEVTRLKLLLSEAEEKATRAKSQAQLTKSGHVYVISNIGSFGDDVFKIGMTRRLEPLVRVKELGDASVPFPFDVHMMISCDDAPKLENELHKVFHTQRVNKVNLRKEYFRTDIDTIVKAVESNHGTVDYIAEPDAFDYNETMNMDEDDFEFVSKELQKIEDKLAGSALDEGFEEG